MIVSRRFLYEVESTTATWAVTGSPSVTSAAGETDDLYLVRKNGQDSLFWVGPHMIGTHAGVMIYLPMFPGFTADVTAGLALWDYPMAATSRLNTLDTAGPKLPAKFLWEYSFLIPAYLEVRIRIPDLEDYLSLAGLLISFRSLYHPSLGIRSHEVMAGIVFE